MSEYLPFASIVIAVVGFSIQFGMFVRPVELEKKHREIIEEAYKKFASLNMVEDMKIEFKEIKSKIDLIYQMLIKRDQQ